MFYFLTHLCSNLDYSRSSAAPVPLWGLPPQNLISLSKMDTGFRAGACDSQQEEKLEVAIKDDGC